MIPEPGKSKDWDTTENLYIEGDNLDALKILKETYAGKVKLIYIDPPYNTGHDFVYDDDYVQTRDEYDAESGDYNEEGGRLVANTEANGRFHSDWCSMMYPRLLLARDLLSKDGLIFISIDDGELDNLKKITDEIFGQASFISCIAVKMSEASGLKMSHVDRRVPKLKEYILCYKKYDTCLGAISVPKGTWDDEYKSIILGVSDEELSYVESVIQNQDRSEAELSKCNSILSNATYQTLSQYFKANGVDPSAQEKFRFNHANRIFQAVSMGAGAAKAVIEKRDNSNTACFFAYETAEKKVYIIKGDFDASSKKPRMQVLFAKDYLSYNPCDFWQDIKTTGLDNEGYVPFKNGKKPLKAIKRIIQLANCDENSIILDFFSGSGTTGEAVMRQCQEDGIRRKFILVQLPENLDEQLARTKGVEKKAIQEAIEMLHNANCDHTISSLAQLRLSKAAENLNFPFADLGFRVLRIDSSNFKDVYFNPDDIVQANLPGMVDNVRDGRSDLDLLFEVLPKLGIPYSAKIEERMLAGRKVFFVDGDKLAACFDANVGADTIEEMAKVKPWYAVIRDSSMADDATHANYEELFRTYSPDTVPQVI